MLNMLSPFKFCDGSDLIVEYELIIHPAKTEAIILRITPFIDPFQPIPFDSGFVKIVTLATYLGVTIDNDFPWFFHT